jgi:hypothetical protein
MRTCTDTPAREDYKGFAASEICTGIFSDAGILRPSVFVASSSAVALLIANLLL